MTIQKRHKIFAGVGSQAIDIFLTISLGWQSCCQIWDFVFGSLVGWRVGWLVNFKLCHHTKVTLSVDNINTKQSKIHTHLNLYENAKEPYVMWVFMMSFFPSPNNSSSGFAGWLAGNEKLVADSQVYCRLQICFFFFHFVPSLLSAHPNVYLSVCLSKLFWPLMRFGFVGCVTDFDVCQFRVWQFYFLRKTFLKYLLN